MCLWVNYVRMCTMVGCRPFVRTLCALNKYHWWKSFAYANVFSLFSSSSFNCVSSYLPIFLPILKWWMNWNERFHGSVAFGVSSEPLFVVVWFSFFFFHLEIFSKLIRVKYLKVLFLMNFDPLSINKWNTLFFFGILNSINFNSKALVRYLHENQLKELPPWQHWANTTAK